MNSTLELDAKLQNWMQQLEQEQYIGIGTGTLHEQ
jgi:hypothetical protein